MKPLSTSAGVTLLEMVLVIAVIAVLSGAAVPAIVGSFKAQAKTQDSGVMLDKTRYALERMAFEIRELSVGSISAMSATSLAFSRVDYAPLTATTYTPTTRALTLNLTPPQILTGANGTSINQCNGKLTLAYSTPALSPSGYVPVLADQVCDLSLAYYDQSNAATTTLTAVRYVQISLTQATTAGGAQVKQSTRIALRNR